MSTVKKSEKPDAPEKDRQEKDKKEKARSPEGSEDWKKDLETDKPRKVLPGQGLGAFLWRRIKKGEFLPAKEGLKGVQKEWQAYQHSKRDEKEKYRAFEAVIEGAVESPEYYVLLVLSCLVATFGLYQNSAAVIIGAMILAPLMGPILGLSAGILAGNLKIFLRVFWTLLKSVALVLAITTGITMLIPFVEVTAQLAARGAPNLFDIGVALASGLVGAYAVVNKRISSSLPGVAISVALMPPLCSVGIGFGLGQTELALGALHLFSINLIGISLAALLVFFRVKLHPKIQEEEEESRARKRVAGQVLVSLALLAAIAVPMGFFTYHSLQTNGQQARVLQALESRLASSHFYDVRLTRSGDNLFELLLVAYPDTTMDVSPEILQARLLEDTGSQVNIRVYGLSPGAREEATEQSGSTEQPGAQD